MKTKIIGIEGRMKELTESMDKINSLASGIDENLAIKRSEITKLDIVNKDLKKLSKLCEFPKILK